MDFLGFAVAGVLGFVFAAILIFFLTLYAIELSLRLAGWLGEFGLVPRGAGQAIQYGLLMFRGLRRNPLRAALTYLAVFVLVLVITLVWSILAFINAVTEDKAKNLKVIVTEKFQLPSQMPPSYGDRLYREALTLPAPQRPTDDDLMTWAFVGGTLDPAKRSFDNSVFFFCMEPRKLLTMMDGLEELTPEQLKLLEAGTKEMERNIKAVVIGVERLRKMNKRVGDRIKLTSINYKDLEFEMDIIGEFPEGRYGQSAIMNRDYLMRTLDAYQADPKRGNGSPHPMADRSLNLVWVRLPDTAAFEHYAAKVSSPGRFASPAVKTEKASSAIGNFLDAYRDILWAMRYLLSPALLVTMALVIANAISISVRERRPEMAVMKVLGYSPGLILLLVLGEALLIGALSGFLSTASAVLLVNARGGIPFPIAFFPRFMVPWDALWWGPALGAGTAFLGSFLPAWSARSVKVSEVFSKVA